MGGPGSGRKKGSTTTPPKQRKYSKPWKDKESISKNKLSTTKLTKERGGYYVKVILHPSGRGSSDTTMDYYKFHKTKTDALKDYKNRK